MSLSGNVFNVTQWKCIFLQFGSCESEVIVLVGFVSSEASLLGLQGPSCPCVFMPTSHCVCVLTSSSCEDTHHIGLGPSFPNNPINSLTPWKPCLPPNTVTFWGTWGRSRFQHRSLGGTESSCYQEAAWVAVGVDVRCPQLSSQQLAAMLGPAGPGFTLCLGSMLQARVCLCWSEIWTPSSGGFEEFLEAWSKDVLDPCFRQGCAPWSEIWTLSSSCFGEFLETWSKDGSRDSGPQRLSTNSEPCR